MVFFVTLFEKLKKGGVLEEVRNTLVYLKYFLKINVKHAFKINVLGKSIL